MADILVVGAGPVGLTLACDLSRQGVAVRVIDKLASPSPYCRAIGVTPRTLEVLEDIGVARELIDAGLRLIGTRNIVNGHLSEEIRDYPDLPYAPLGVAQYDTERVLARHLSDFGVEIERGSTLMSLKQTGDSVLAGISQSESDRDSDVVEQAFRYVVGCDGAHSAVRRLMNIGFEGEAFPYDFILGDVHMDYTLPRGMSLRVVRPRVDGPPDMFIAIPLAERGRYRVSMLAPPGLNPPSDGVDHGIQSERPAPGLAHLQAVADDLLPGQIRLDSLRWSSLFRISMRLATQYRVGNVFIAGDAAHIHPPTGGQGMNTGIQDAYNLAWKLALVIRGRANVALLDSYEPERQAVGLEVIRSTVEASRNLGQKQDPNRARLADTQVLVSYRDPALANAPGLQIGDRAPDANGLQRSASTFPVRVFDLLRGTGYVLLIYCATDAALDEAARQIHDCDLLRTGVLRACAIVPATLSTSPHPYLPHYTDPTSTFAAAYGTTPTTTLIRPDGYIVWRGDSSSSPGWRDALKQVLM